MKLDPNSYYKMIPDVGDIEYFSAKPVKREDDRYFCFDKRYEAYPELQDYRSEFIENIRF